MSATDLRIGVTVGDVAGIGPEVVAKALRTPLPDGAHAVVYATPEVFDAAWVETSAVFELVDVGVDGAGDVSPGSADPRAARLQLAALRRAVADARAGRIDAIVTAPWTKSLFATIDAPVLGHTEHLAELFEVGDRHRMMLAGDRLRVVLATTHIPLRAVPDAITVEGVADTIVLTHSELRKWYGIDDPSVAVCGLNPHAGEEGHMGREEIDVIVPAIERARSAGIRVAGPFPADTLFPRFRDASPYDAVVAMYHDQGLIPLKYAHFGASANITLGLPTIRTSVDHGSALDIAGQGIADASSMRYALELAVQLAKNGGTP